LGASAAPLLSTSRERDKPQPSREGPRAERAEIDAHERVGERIMRRRKRKGPEL